MKRETLPEALRIAQEFRECAELQAIPSERDINAAGRYLKKQHARIAGLEAELAATQAAGAIAIEKVAKYDHLLPYLCKTCGGYGLVDRRCQDDPLGAEDCPDCAKAAPAAQAVDIKAAPAAVAVPDWVEALAESWDGCMYDAPGETIDIGASIRRAALAAPQAQNVQLSTAPAADAEVVLPRPCAHLNFDEGWFSTLPKTVVCRPSDEGAVPVYTEQQVRALLAGVAKGERAPSLGQLNELARRYSESYASPHCFTLGVGSLQAIFEVLAAQGSER